MTSTPPAAALVLGGTSIVGRHVVELLVASKRFDHIRAVDRIPIPTLAFLTAAQETAFKSVEYIQANLINAATVARVFNPPEGFSQYTHVYNCTWEMRADQVPEYYHERVEVRSAVCAAEAAKRGTPVYVQLSSGKAYVDGGEDAPQCDESATMEAFSPWSKYLLAMCDSVRSQAALNVVIVRVPVVYGPGHVNYVASLMAVAYTCARLGHSLDLPLYPRYRRNTVAAFDVARAMIHTADWYLSKGFETGHKEVFNCADLSDTRAGDMFTVFAQMFPKLKYKMLKEPRTGCNDVAISEDRMVLNEQLLEAWLGMFAEDKVLDAFNGMPANVTSPFIDSEMYSRRAFSVKGDGRIVTETGFTYMAPKFDKERLSEMISEWKRHKAWPLKDL